MIIIMPVSRVIVNLQMCHICHKYPIIPARYHGNLKKSKLVSNLTRFVGRDSMACILFCVTPVTSGVSRGPQKPRALWPATSLSVPLRGLGW